MNYDNNNIFAKILRGEIPCNKIYEDDFVLSFYDINPQKKIHALVIPKGKYIDLDDFSDNASSDEIVGLIKGINIVAKKLGISSKNGKGYRALANINASSPCYEDSLTLSKDISGYLDEKEQREWDLNYEKYKDDLAIKNRNLDNEAARINAVRDIGVAYGQNQPKNVTYKSIY